MAPSQDTGETPNKQRKTKLFAVRPSRPCPVCGGDHKCSTGADGLIICGRSKGSRRRLRVPRPRQERSGILPLPQQRRRALQG